MQSGEKVASAVKPPRKAARVVNMTGGGNRGLVFCEGCRRHIAKTGKVSKGWRCKQCREG